MLVKEWLSSLELTSSSFIIRLVWMPVHNGIDGNCKAGELAKVGTLTLHTSECERVGPLLSSATTSFCATTRYSWTKVERSNLPLTIGRMLTGYCPIHYLNTSRTLSEKIVWEIFFPFKIYWKFVYSLLKINHYMLLNIIFNIIFFCNRRETFAKFSGLWKYSSLRWIFTQKLYVSSVLKPV